MARMAGLVAALAAGLAAQAAAQGAAPVEVTRQADREITLHLFDFLDAEERALLQVIATSAEALEVMVGGAGADGHAALALAPAEGFVRDGVPSEAAHAVAQLADADTARAAALEGCEAARSAGPACVVVLEVAPVR